MADGPMRTPGPQAGGRARVLVGGVGYRNLSDLSLGPYLIDRLKDQSWPPGVDVEDLSYGPIGVMHNLDARGPYERIVLVSGVGRERIPGGIYCYAWDHRLPDAEEIQARVAEAVTGVISLDNLLIIATYFGKLPREVFVVEVEARDEGFGEELSEIVHNAVPEVMAMVRRKAGAS